MATAQELKARVQAHLDKLKGERLRAEADYATKIAELDAQIKGSERLLAAWDNRTDSMIAILESTGISIGGLV